VKVLVVCARRYNGHELWTALGVIQESGIDFEVVSQDLYIQDEVTGQSNVIDRTVYQVDPSEVALHDGLMIVSGNMKDTESYWNDRAVLRLVEEAHKNDKVIAAICCSVPTIRKVAKGKMVSAFPLIRSKELLRREGAILQSVAWTVDGKLITAEHQMATQMWAENFCRVLKGEAPHPPLHDSGYMPKGRPTKPLPEVERLKGASSSS
jgi:protease I